MRSLRLQRRYKPVCLGNRSLHVADESVHIRLNTRQFSAQTGDRPGVEIVLHEEDLVTQGGQRRFA